MQDTVKKILDGDIRTVARVISDIDDKVPGVRDILKELYPHTGRAYIIGVTGAPGVGKSTLVDRMLVYLRKEQKKVGILAVDPTSPFSGGAILGDRIRMQRHNSDEDVFIRSMATRGHFGGLTHSTRSAIDVLDAMGKDYIIVETVGVGQDEVDIVKNSHSTIVVVIPGMGDDIQAIKAGVLEVGDIFVINKSDRDGADMTMKDLRSMIDTGHHLKENGGWVPPILKTEAINDIGIENLIKEIKNHRSYLHELSNGLNLRSNRETVREELTGIIRDRLIDEVLGQLTDRKDFEEIIDSILEGRANPYSVSDDILDEYLPKKGY